MARKTIKIQNPTQKDMSTASYRDIKPITYRAGEIWLPVITIPNLQDWYYVSNYGRVYSRFTDTLIKPRYIGRGYLTVTLRTIDNKPIDILVHRLVMMAFEPISNPQDFQVNHIDGSKTRNYYPENLEWATQTENMKHAYEIGLRKPGEANNFCKITEDKAIEICKLLELKKYTTKEIAEQVGLKGHEPLITQIKLRHNWKHISKDYDF